MRLKVLGMLLFLILPFSSVAGGISRDTSCAVVLYNGARYAMDASLGNVFVIKSYNRKIRINTEEGVKYASVAIPYYRFMEYTERVGGIKVTVGNGAVDDKGRPVERKMPRECIVDVRTDVNRWEKRFTVPDVAPGDTINIRYEISGMFPEYYERGYDSNESENFFMAFGFITKYGVGEDIVFPKWIFQEDIPVMESVLEVTHFADYRFGHNLIGNEDIVFVEQPGGVCKIMQRAIAPRKHYSISTHTENIINTGGIRPAYTDRELRKMTFSATGLMPLGNTEYKYVINPQKYRASVEFDLKGRKIDVDRTATVIEAAGDYNYSDTWTDVGKILFNSRHFGRRIFFSQDFYRDYTDSVLNLSIPDYDKVQMICSHIRNDITLASKDVGMYINNFKDVYASKSGSNVDICAIAWKTLDRAGFKPRMVMLKSRDKGHLYNGGISVGALNAVVLHITLKDGSTVLFDPTGNPKDPRLINPMYLVSEGIVYNRGEEQINLMNAVENREYHNAALYVGADGMTSGNCRSIFTNHSAYEMEGAAPQINAEEGEVKYGTLDSLQSLYTREFSFRRTSAVMVDDKLFISPFAEKYFRAEDFAGPRKYPVEFRNPKTIEYTATIHIPDGYEVYDLPRKSTWQQHRCGASATILAKAQGDIVQFGLTIELDNATIPLEDYPQFQEWWQQMCSLFDEMIILRRKGGKSFTDTEKMTA